MGTRFCNQFTTTIPKNSVFSGISGVFLLLEFNDRYLVCTISSGLYYNLTTRFIHIIYTILFYRISFGQELVSDINSTFPFYLKNTKEPPPNNMTPLDSMTLSSLNISIEHVINTDVHSHVIQSVYVQRYPFSFPS